MPRALRRSRSSFSPPPKSALSFERNEGLLLPLSFSSPEELSPAAAPDDEDAAERTTTRDREALPLFSPPGSGGAEQRGRRGRGKRSTSSISTATAAMEELELGACAPAPPRPSSAPRRARCQAWGRARNCAAHFVAPREARS